MRKAVRYCVYVMFVLVLMTSLGVSYAFAADDSERDFSFYAEHSDISATAGQEIGLSLMVDNNGEVAEDIDFNISTPEDWTANLSVWTIKDAEIHNIHLEPNSDAKKLDLKCMSPAGTAEGEYTITVTATTDDLQIERSVDLTIRVLEGEIAPVVEGDLELTSDYPTLHGDPGSTLEFKIQITNKLGEDRTFDLSAELPQHFDANFSPAFDKGKIISALQIKSNSSESVAMRVSVGADVEEDTYPIVFRASSANVSSTIDFEATVTGTHKISLVTDREVLSSNATAGQESHITLFVINDGTAPMESISFSSPSKPVDWEVTFEPDKVEYMEPGQFEEIDAIIKPKSKAIAGDYMVSFMAHSSQASDSLEYRVSVETSSLFGVIGIVIVILVLAALLGIFLKLKRR